MPNYIQALRDCCQDEAAFERLKQILASAVKDEAFTKLLLSLDSQLRSNASCLPDLVCQPPKQNIPKSHPPAIARISGYEEEVIGSSSIEINARVNSLDRLRMERLLQSEGAVHNWEYEFHNKSGEVLVGLLSAEIIKSSLEEGEFTLTTNIMEPQRAQVQMRVLPNRDRVCTTPPFSHKVWCSARLLGEMALRIRNSLNLDRILDSTVEEVRQFLQADRVFIGCVNDFGRGQILAESVDPKWESIKGWKLDETYVKEIKSFYEDRNVRVIDDTDRIEKTPFLKEYYSRYQVKASLGVPIIVESEFFGVLVANQCSSPRHWQPFEIDLLEKLATQVAIAIKQAQLYKQVQTLNANLERQVEERTAQLQQRNRELQELNRIKDVLLHTVSHDLRTSVMGTLMVFKNWLARSEENISISRKLLERMVAGIDRQLKTIHSLLETHTSEEQGTIIHREFVRFNTLLLSIIKDLEPMLAENQASLTNLVPDNLPLVILDPTQIQRVFESLFTHTLKHNPPGLCLSLSATVEAGTIRCHIQDNGTGMSQVECDRLFDLYVRDPQARCSTGIGLKLYLCRQIIQAHGGQIGVTSSRGSGSNFWFTLPVANC
ncbi:sensor histidine kinase [Aerosakkonema funiforme]|uniref:histidine kinase n=2 Tax=Oscillatoriophycideae TaxID=1301283 RepID=A0A926VM02_9CYAN|nr:GAF domain-containing protein [Aerosakkonema funiforme]MBD2186385.1 GAF domain-containing protein [Aerosakkonema funiforme FACHB-1375]